MNRKGQLDKALGALPIFFLVIVIVAIFIALTMGLFSAKKYSDHLAVSSTLQMPLLFDIVSLDIEGKNERMTILQAFNLARINSETRIKLEEEILKLTPEDGCLAFLWIDENEIPLSDVPIPVEAMTFGFFAKSIEGKIEKTSFGDGKKPTFRELYKSYSERSLLEEKEIILNSDKKQYAFMTYSGRCLDV